MKNRLTFLFIASIVALQSFAQYGVSNAEFDYYDEDRTRWIETHVYYPSVIDDGTSETFPFLVIGHGFSINFAKYAYLWEYFVPQGYIVILPNTETGTFGVEHDEFGYDLGFLAGYFYEQSLNPESLFYNNVEPFPAVMGHSMGGGATHIAAESYTGDIGIAVSFAAAETDPSAIDACENADIPVYIFYGEADAVSPPDENQILMYNNSNSSCKTMINILGGGHCYFALSDWICDIADSSPTSIEREEQHDIVTDFLDLILDYELKGNQLAECILTDSLINSSRIDYERSCQMTAFSIEATANPPAGGEITGAGMHTVCSTISLTATANGGYEFVNWTEGGTEISINETFDINVMDNRNFVANFSETVNLNLYKKHELEIYPNPAHDIINIKNLPDETITAHIYTISGKLIEKNCIKDTINISKLDSGTYLIKLMNAQDEIIYLTRISKTK